MNVCPRPLDPLDAEAVASGAEPPIAPDAAVHASTCPACASLVEQSRGLSLALEALATTLAAPPDLASRVTRLRSFSRRERRTYALWRGPVLLLGALALAGLILVLATPALSGREQAGLAAAAVAPLLAFLRSATRWAPEIARMAPSALEALSGAFAAERSLGYVALLLLAPSLFGLSRVFVRSRAGSRR